MTAADKRIAAMRRNPRGVRPADLEATLLAEGFSKRSGKGDHRVFVRGAQRFTLDYGVNPVKSVYVKEFLKLLDEWAEL